MTAHARSCLTISLLLASLTSQHSIWTEWNNDHQAYDPATYGDLDGDGVNDLLIAFVQDVMQLNWEQQLRILSGADGSVLWRQTFPMSSFYRHVAGVGDVNGDGTPEIAVSFSVHPAFPSELRVLSPLQNTPLWVGYGQFYHNYGTYTVGLNLDSDSKHEVLTASISQDSKVYAYDDDGSLLYTIPIQQQTGEIVRGLGRIGDIDGDGADDFGVGLIEATSRGVVSVRSGRTGAEIRRDLGPLYGDAVGHEVKPMGDFDRDGIPDYVTGNRNGFRGLAVAYSGATGQVLREWTGNSGLTKQILAGLDLDLDGVPDVVTGGPHVNPVGAGFTYGRVAAFSGRDGEVLWEELNVPGMTQPGALLLADDRYLGDGLANLGPTPGNPYPIVAVYDRPWKIFGYTPTGIPIAAQRGRIRAFRANLPGTALVGTGCASVGRAPRIGVRHAAGVPGSGLRVTVSDVAPSAFAWLLVGLGTAPPPMLNLQYGCQLLVSPDVILSRMSGSVGLENGYAAVWAPQLVAPGGFSVAAQWLCLDPTTMAVAMSPRHELSIL